MDLSTILLITLLVGAIFGAKKPLLGGISGLIFASTLSIIFISSEVLFLVIVTFICFFFSIASGLAGSIFYVGIQSKRRKDEVANFGGFGVHHPGGIILSNSERKGIKLKNTKRELLISY